MELYTDRDEQQTNEMLSILIIEGIDARKIKSDNGWSTHVAKENMPYAVQILKNNGYPKIVDDKNNEKKGIIQTPGEARERQRYLLKKELEEAISQMDGVILARVIMALPEQNILDDIKTPASASVIVKHHENSPIVDRVSKIKAIVVNAVEGLPYENVSVSFDVVSNSNVYANKSLKKLNDSNKYAFYKEGYFFAIILFLVVIALFLYMSKGFLYKSIFKKGKGIKKPLRVVKSK